MLQGPNTAMKLSFGRLNLKLGEPSISRNSTFVSVEHVSLRLHPF